MGHPDFAWKRDLYVAIGKRVREYREKNGMSLTQTAERLGCATSTLHNIETGALSSPIYILVMLAHLWDTTLDELVPIDCEVKLRDGVGPRQPKGLWEKAEKVIR